MEKMTKKNVETWICCCRALLEFLVGKHCFYSSFMQAMRCKNSLPIVSYIQKSHIHTSMRNEWVVKRVGYRKKDWESKRIWNGNEEQVKGVQGHDSERSKKNARHRFCSACDVSEELQQSWCVHFDSVEWLSEEISLLDLNVYILR